MRQIAQIGLAVQHFDHRVVEKVPGRFADDERLVNGDAADIDVLRQAGLMKTPTVMVTTHDDDMNVYLTLYCRRLRPDVQIISRATVERNISTLYRAGADFVLSYASMGANEVFNSLNRTDVLLVAEGLDVFTMETPKSLVGKTLEQAEIRSTTGCSVIAIEGDAGLQVNPPPHAKLSNRGKLVLIGGADSQERFIRQFVRR